MHSLPLWAEILITVLIHPATWWAIGLAVLAGIAFAARALVRRIKRNPDSHP